MLETVIKRDRDLGTPARESTQTVTLTIDGQEVTVPEGSSLMRAAAEAGINIPKSAPPTALNPSARAACAWCRSTDAGAIRHPAPRRPSTAWWCTPRRLLRELRRGVMELYISDHPLDCLTCPANGDCELQDMAGVVGLRGVRYGYQGANHLDSARTSPIRTSPTTRPSASSATAACAPARNPGHLRPDHLRQGFESRVSPGQTSRSWTANACPAALRAGLPHVHAAGKDRHHDGPGRALGDHHLRLLRRGLRFQGRDEGPGSGAHGALEGRPGQPWPFLRKRPLRLGYATHKERVLKPMIRQRITDPWREVSWDEAINHAASKDSAASRRATGATPSATSPHRAAPTRETWLVQKLNARGLRHQQRRHLRPRLPLAHRLRPEADAGRIGSTQTFDSVMHTDVVIVMGANPAATRCSPRA